MPDPVDNSLPQTPFATAEKLRQRLVNAVLAQTGFNHRGLNAHLRDRLTSPDGASGGLVTEPVIEGAAPYAAGTASLADLRGRMLLEEIVGALTDGPDQEYRFPSTMRPYLHQIEAWEHLTASDPRSVLVTSGTGSGKTECFLVPLLDDLAREAAAAKQSLSGVRAIMLYPLNALIASQQERLRAWSTPFEGRVRFGLYNGMTPSDLREADRRDMARKHPEQVFDRKTLRSDPPPILVTNVTMLEYLTIRKEDRPLIEKSQGKLRWIIIDEAHSYVGSAAAEIALLLRRVLQTFGVSAADVRFVATSATIGEANEESRVTLRRFLAQLAGVDEGQVYVVQGTREGILLPPVSGGPKLASLDRREVAANVHVQDLVRAAEKVALSRSQAEQLVKPTGRTATEILGVLADDRGQDPLLPIRVHHFMRAISGLWSCLNPACTGPKPQEWPFGALALERTEQCPQCQSPMFEIVGCRDCGEPFLQAFDDGTKLLPRSTEPDADEFAAASEAEAEISDDFGSATSGSERDGDRRFVAVRDMPNLVPLHIDLATGRVPDNRDSGQICHVTPLHWEGECPHCNAAGRDDDTGPIRPFRYGAPFLIGNAAPVMLDGMPPMDQKNGRLPADGRRLLSFTDSRQGTARFAANIEVSAERSYIRGYVYNLVQKSQTLDSHGTESIEQLRLLIDDLAIPARSSPAIANIRDEKIAEYERKSSGVDAGVPWGVVSEKLSQDPMVQHWIREVWKDRDSRFSKSPAKLADFLLLRELARRPRRANSLETLGLAQLRFPTVDRLGKPSLPSALERRGKSVDDWRDFLYLLVDAPVRSYFALSVSHEDVRWLLPRGGVRRKIVGPRQDKGSQTDIAWPLARAGSVRSNPVIWLERSLGLDATSGEGRAEVNDILEAAWRALQPLFDSVGSEYSLDLSKAVIAPVSSAWLCPVTRRVLVHRLFGKSPYGHRESSPFTLEDPAPLNFPSLPAHFARTRQEREAAASWLACDPRVANLRELGIWRDIHDRAAMLDPYIRSEEHSAQQPPDRLRGFEQEFREGKINMLACSTTMEMGVDIGSVSAVMMTNVPPSIANYRQRIGRAGRRRQGFASSLTLSRDTPLDRETFRDPARYLSRQLRPPQVTLDAPRIVQRHVNALLLATWFAEASGELLRIKVGDFFGFVEDPTQPNPDSGPVHSFLAWMADPSVQARLSPRVEQLAAGTALHNNPSLFASSIEQFDHARAGFEQQWTGLSAEFQAAPPDAARTSIALQLRRLCKEHLLKELANRAILPGHGFPTGVVPFINDSRERRAMSAGGSGSPAAGRYDYPSRNADIAIREYAPGAEVVIDGLVWQSAGVTLNWQRSAHDDAYREIQSLRHFWECDSCGAADSSLTRVEACPVCSESPVQGRRFLEPAGFRVDWNQSPHAETDKVIFIEPEAPRISARGASWEPLLDPNLGRGRCNTDGLVFYSSSGASKRNYRICLDCGRAAEDNADGSNPLGGHAPLRGGGKDGPAACEGNMRSFAITEPVALGHEILTDVVEFQPASIESLGASWALASALREALSRRLGIQAGELGMGVDGRTGALGQRTFSVFLFDKNSGGAGFSTSLLDDVPQLLMDAESILDCKVPGCEHGCSACVLTLDLFAQQETIDRKAALWTVRQLLSGMRSPKDDDIAVDNAMLSRPIADELIRRARAGDGVIIYASESFNLNALDHQPFSSLLSTLRGRGVKMAMAITAAFMQRLDAAQRLGLRDAALRNHIDLLLSEPPLAPNGATLIASLMHEGRVMGWLSRDHKAKIIDMSWGLGADAPVVVGSLDQPPPALAIDTSSLLAKSTTAVREIDGPGRPMRLFGDWFAKEVAQLISGIGLWLPGELLSIHYSDRYLRSPLSVGLAINAMASIAKSLKSGAEFVPLKLTSAPLDDRKQNIPNSLHHDWQRADHRAAVVDILARGARFDCTFEATGAGHAREINLQYTDGKVARIYLDQGFGYWQPAAQERFDFAAPPAEQVRKLNAVSTIVRGKGKTFMAALAPPG